MRMESEESPAIRNFMVYTVHLIVFRVIKSIWAGIEVSMEEHRSALKILADEPVEKRPLERFKHMRENNIRMDIKEIYPEANIRSKTDENGE